MSLQRHCVTHFRHLSLVVSLLLLPVVGACHAGETRLSEIKLPHIADVEQPSTVVNPHRRRDTALVSKCDPMRSSGDKLTSKL